MEEGNLNRHLCMLQVQGILEVQGRAYRQGRVSFKKNNSSSNIIVIITSNTINKHSNNVEKMAQEERRKEQLVAVYLPLPHMAMLRQVFVDQDTQPAVAVTMLVEEKVDDAEKKEHAVVLEAQEGEEYVEVVLQEEEENV